jgi:hypothetical protein
MIEGASLVGGWRLPDVGCRERDDGWRKADEFGPFHAIKQQLIKKTRRTDLDNGEFLSWIYGSDTA